VTDANARGGRDNVTAVLVRILDAEPVEAAS
jgi:serine/threonine protein phosphatase PrpC